MESVIARPPKFVCKIHGEQQTAMNITIFNERKSSDYADILLAQPIKLQRNYCIECLIDTLDLLGIENMKRGSNNAP
jgi:hypothetical protein